MVIPLPILPQEVQQARGEHDTTIALPFPLADREHHAGTIDIGHLEVTEFRDTQPRGIECSEDGACFEAPRGLEEGRHVGVTQHRGSVLGRLGGAI